VQDAPTIYDLIVGRVYKALPDPQEELLGYLRIVDESGEDYTFPAENFERVDLSPDTGKGLDEQITVHLTHLDKAILRAEALAAQKSISSLVREWIEERLDLPLKLPRQHHRIHIQKRPLVPIRLGEEDGVEHTPEVRHCCWSLRCTSASRPGKSAPLPAPSHILPAPRRRDSAQRRWLPQPRRTRRIRWRIHPARWCCVRQLLCGFPALLLANPSCQLALCEASRIRSSPAYSVKRSPRRKPTSVTPNSRATSTARWLAAETAQTIGALATVDFCRIS